MAHLVGVVSGLCWGFFFPKHMLMHIFSEKAGLLQVSDPLDDC